MIAISTSPHVTAEWQCTQCNTTNRKFLGADAIKTQDRCMACRARHEVTRGERPVRWNSRAV